MAHFILCEERISVIVSTLIKISIQETFPNDPMYSHTPLLHVLFYLVIENELKCLWRKSTSHEMKGANEQMWLYS